MTPDPDAGLTEVQLAVLEARAMRAYVSSASTVAFAPDHQQTLALVAALRAAWQERDDLRAALRRYTDIVELSKEDYRAKYGSIEDYADAMDEFYRAALAVLGRDRAPAPPEGAP